MALFGDYAQSGYQSQFVARPTDLLAQQSDMLQAKYDAAKLNTMKMQQLANSIQVIKEQKPLLERELSKYEQTIGELAQRGDWENLGTEVEALAMDLGKNMQSGNLGVLAGNFRNFQEYQKAKQELEKDGKYGQWNDDYQRYLGRNRTQNGYDFEQSGAIDQYQFSGLTAAQDHQKRATEMMKDIAKDGYLKDYVGLDADGNIVGTKQGSEHVLSGKVREIAERKASSFLATQEGMDFARMVSYANPGVDATQLHAAAADYLYTNATNQIFNKSTAGNDFSYAPKYIRDEKKFDAMLNNPTTSYLEGETNQAQAATSYLDEIKVDKNGNPIIAGSVEEYDYGNAIAGGTGMTHRTKTATELADENKAVAKAARGMIRRFDEAHPDKANWTPDRKVKYYQEARKNNQTVTPRVVNLTLDAMTEQTKLAVNNGNLGLLSGRKFVVNGEEFGNVNELVQELGLKDPSKYRINVKGVSVDDPYGMSGGEVLAVTDISKGKTYNIYTSPATTELDDAFQDTRAVVLAARSGVPNKIITRGNLQYDIENRPVDTNSGPNIATTVTIRYKDKNGGWHTQRNPINNSLEFSLEDIIQNQHENRKNVLNSYYHSNFNASKEEKAIE